MNTERNCRLSEPGRQAGIVMRAARLFWGSERVQQPERKPFGDKPRIRRAGPIAAVLFLLLAAAPVRAVVNGAGQDIIPQAAIFYSSVTVAGGGGLLVNYGITAASAAFSSSVTFTGAGGYGGGVYPSTASALGGGLTISTNVYIVGFSSAAKYYGDGSALTGLGGSGSSLNADLLDGLDSLDFVRKTGSVTETITGAKTFTGYTAVTTMSVTGASTFTASMYMTGVSSFTSVNNIYIAGGAANQVLATNGPTGSLKWTTVSASGDNLGNHVATTTLNMAGNSIVNAASGTFTQGITASSFTAISAAGAGLSVSSSAYLAVSGGNVGIGTTAPGAKLDINGMAQATAFTSTIFQSTPTASLVIQSPNIGGGSGSAGSVTISASASGAVSGGSGGNVTIQAGANQPQGGAGYTNLGNAGVVNILGGGGANSVGGNVNINAGPTSWWATSIVHADVVVTGGTGLGVNDPGSVTVEGGHAGNANNSVSSGGNVLIKAGTGYGGGGSGAIQLLSGNVGIGTAAPATKLHVSGGFVTVDGSGAGITTTGGVTASSFTALGASLGVDTAKVRFTNNGIVVSSASPAQYGGVYISTNVYLAAGAKFYGDGSGLTGGDNLGNHVATTTLNMASFNISGANQITASSAALSGQLIVYGTTTLKFITASSAALSDQLVVYGTTTLMGYTAVTTMSVTGTSTFTASMYIAGVSSFTSVNNIYIAGGAASQVLATNGPTGSLKWTAVSALGDNLGNHVATTTLNMAGYNVQNAGYITASSAALSGQLVAYGTSTLKYVNASSMTLSDELVVYGTTTLKYVTASSATLSGQLIVYGTTTLRNVTASSATFSDQLTVYGTTTLTGYTTVTTMSVTGSSTFTASMYIAGVSSFTNVNNIYIAGGAANQVLATNGPTGSLKWAPVSALGDNLGNHVATTTLNMSGYQVVNVSTIVVTGLDGGILLSPYIDTTKNYVVSQGIAIGNNTYSNYDSGIGIGYYANNNYSSGMGVGYYATDNHENGVGVGAHSSFNYSYGVGVGYGADNNYYNGVGIGAGASNNNGSGVGVGVFASGNSNNAVGIGAFSQNNKTYGSALGAYSYAASSSTALGSYAKANAKQSIAIGAGTINNSTGTAEFGVYAINTSSNLFVAGNVGIGTTAPATKLHVSGGVLTVDGAGAGITTTGGITASSFTALGASLGVDTAKLRFTDNGIIVSSASPAQYGGVYISTNVYLAAGAKYYGDGSGLTGGDNLGNHVATTTLNMSNFNISGANQITASSAALSGQLIVYGTTTLRFVTASSMALRDQLVVYGTTTLKYVTASSAMLSGQLVVYGTTSLKYITASSVTLSDQLIVYGSATLAGYTAVTTMSVTGSSTFTASMYIAGVSSFSDVGNIYITGGAANQVLATNGPTGSLKWTSVSSLGDNLGNHTAVTTLNMAGNSIINAASGTFTQGVTASSFTATGIGLNASRLLLSNNVVISSEADALKGGGVNISSNVYIVGFSSAARYYGDGSQLTGIPDQGTFRGATSSTYNGNRGGYAVANGLCAAEYTGSHVCTNTEILFLINAGRIASFPANTTLWISNGPPGYTVNANDCQGWTSASATDYGPVWNRLTAGEGFGSINKCDSVSGTPRKFACCI